MPLSCHSPAIVEADPPLSAQALRAVPSMMEDSAVFPLRAGMLPRHARRARLASVLGSTPRLDTMDLMPWNLRADIKKCESKLRQRRKTDSPDPADPPAHEDGQRRRPPSASVRRAAEGRPPAPRRSDAPSTRQGWQDGYQRTASPSRSEDSWHSAEDARPKPRPSKSRQQLEPLDSARSRRTSSSDGDRMTVASASTVASSVSSPRRGRDSNDELSPDRGSRRGSRRSYGEISSDRWRHDQYPSSSASRSPEDFAGSERGRRDPEHGGRWSSLTHDEEWRPTGRQGTGSVELEHAAREADERLRGGKAVAALFLLEEALAGHAGTPATVGDVLRRAAGQLESEMQAARDYAHGRDGEVYKLSVARKQAEDDVSAVRATIQEQKRKVQLDLADQRRAHDAELAQLETELGQTGRREIEELEQTHDRARMSWKDELRAARAEADRLIGSTKDELRAAHAEADRLVGSTSALEHEIDRQSETVVAAEAVAERAASELGTLRLERQEAQARIAEFQAGMSAARREVEGVRQVAATQQQGSSEHVLELERKLECAKAVVKQWTSKCKELKDDGARQLADAEATSVADSKRAAAVAMTEQDGRDRLTEEVATLRKDRMRERRSAESATARAAELELELEKRRTEVVGLVGQVDRLTAASDRTRSDGIAKRAAEKALANLGAENASLKEERSTLLSELETAELARAELARKVESSAKDASAQREAAAAAHAAAEAAHTAAEVCTEQQLQAEVAAEAARAAEAAQAAALVSAEEDAAKAAGVASADTVALRAEVNSLRAELSSSAAVVERANATAEELHAALQDKESMAARLSDEVTQQEAAIDAAERAAVEAQEAAEQTVRGMMSTLNERLSAAGDRAAAAAEDAAKEKSELESDVAAAAAATRQATEEMAELRAGLGALKGENARLVERHRAATSTATGRRMRAIEEMAEQVASMASTVTRAKEETLADDMAFGLMN